MPDCELQSTCPFFANYIKGDCAKELAELAELIVKRYCYGDYAWCGRYMVYKRLELELENIISQDNISQTSE